MNSHIEKKTQYANPVVQAKQKAEADLKKNQVFEKAEHILTNGMWLCAQI